jgi:hypothetical protein
VQDFKQAEGLIKAILQGTAIPKNYNIPLDILNYFNSSDTACQKIANDYLSAVILNVMDTIKYAQAISFFQNTASDAISIRQSALFVPSNNQPISTVESKIQGVD